MAKEDKIRITENGKNFKIIYMEDDMPCVKSLSPIAKERRNGGAVCPSSKSRIQLARAF